VLLSINTWLIILFSLLLIAAFFSSSEISLFSLNRYRLRYLVKQKNPKAIRVNKILSQPDRLLGVILIGSTLANILAEMVATLIGQRLYGDLGVAIATLMLAIILLVFAEMVPKTLAAMYSERIAFLIAKPLKWFLLLFFPMVRLLSSTANLILRLFGVNLSEVSKEALTGEELRSVVHEASLLLPSEHKTMLVSLLDLEQATVEDIMVPKSEIVGINLDQPWSVLIQELETAQHTRLPLYRTRIDDIVGMIHLRDVLNLVFEESFDMEHLLEIADQPYFIPEATPLNIQLLNFQKMKRRSCFVVDEYGELRGLVTMEDILEEIVGEFTTDVAALSKDVTLQQDGSIIVDGGMTIRTLNRMMSWHLPFIGPRTLSGLIIEQLGYIPPADCCVLIENYQLEILKVSDNMIKSIHMWKINKKRKAST
jgi:Mg2+/Co2+ transporter CorB